MSSKPAHPILIVTADPQVTFLLDQVLRSAGYSVTLARDLATAEQGFQSNLPDLVILNGKQAGGSSLDLARDLVDRYPALPVILLVDQDSPDFLRTALRSGVASYLCFPLHTDEILEAVQDSINHSQKLKDWMVSETRLGASDLYCQLDELATLSRMSRSITSSLDLDRIFGVIVDSAVKITHAEEASLMLVDDETGELFLRAARNFQEEFARTFHVPVKDSLPGRVIQTGLPVLLNENTPIKIKTMYLVTSLLYVPLKSQDRVLGVLGVDNRKNHTPFSEHHVSLLSSIADAAVIAIENSRLYVRTSVERNKLEMILTRMNDGVIVFDQEKHIVLVNQTIKDAFYLGETNLVGKPVLEVFGQSDLQELLKNQDNTPNRWVEIATEDGRVFNAVMVALPDIGWAVTINDITSLKRLDRIKSEFVGTVSHDLRSPLTSILGYVELLERVGPLNEIQREFIERVQASVHNITSLVDDLLNLGRIEAGTDARKEIIHMNQIINVSISNIMSRASGKGIRLSAQIPEKFPPLFGNPVQIRQLMDNLLDNAIKYTPANGSVLIKGFVEQNQIILQISDSGMGIPAIDLPYIFDKFYRASNIPGEVNGTGLGLSIVKSVVEAHQGRIWVNSTPDVGTVFTIVLPVAEE